MECTTRKLKIRKQKSQLFASREVNLHKQIKKILLPNYDFSLQFKMQQTCMMFWKEEAYCLKLF